VSALTKKWSAFDAGGPLVPGDQLVGLNELINKRWTIQQVADFVVALIRNGVPEALDTLKEIADQLAADESAASALTTAVAGKLAKASNLSDLASASTARGNLGLGNVEDKSSATVRSELTLANVTAALGYAPTSVTGLTGAQTITAFKTGLALVKADVGLGSVDNTSDLGKPISTAEQAALNLKANLASPALTGTPTAPTAVDATSNTQIATTAFVHSLITGVLGTAPAALDTLQELAASLGNDANFSGTVTTSLATKLVKTNNLSDLTDAAAARTNLSLVVGTNVQAYSALLAAYAGAGWSAGVQVPALTAANTVVMKTIGSATGNVLDKAAGDALYLPLLGAAASATKLATARTIAGVAFDGTANIVINDTDLSGVAWTTYTISTLTPNVGAFGSASATGKYKKIGKTVFVFIEVTITTNGTAAGYVFVNLPFAPKNRTPLSCKEGQAVGTGGMADALTGGSAIYMKYDNSYLGGDGYIIRIGGSYEAV
jgi:hypothetical protein